jgi:hypothetical protein
MAIDDTCGSSVLRKIRLEWNEEDTQRAIKELQRVSYELSDYTERLERTSRISQETLDTTYY